MGIIRKVILVMLALLIYSHHPGKDYSKVPIDEKSRALDDGVIINSIQKEMIIFSKGINELNAELVFSIFSIRRDAGYVRNGYRYPSIERARNCYANTFKSLEYTSQSVAFDSTEYQMLQGGYVKMNTIGKIVANNPQKTGQCQWVINYQIVWIKEEDRWKIIYMSNSWQ